MILEIKDMVSSDVTKVWDWNPSNLDEIYFNLELEIGDIEEDSADIFQVIVATPEAIRYREKTLPSHILGRKYLIVLTYNWKDIEKELVEIVRECSDKTWEKCVSNLTKYFLWEYEGHEYLK